MDLAKECGIKVHEKNLDLYDIYEADEAFLTSTPYCMVPATKINGLNIGDGKPGKITMKLLSAWGEKNGVNILEQSKYYHDTGTTSSSNPFVELKQ